MEGRSTSYWETYTMITTHGRFTYDEQGVAACDCKIGKDHTDKRPTQFNRLAHEAVGRVSSFIVRISNRVR